MVQRIILFCSLLIGSALGNNKIEAGKIFGKTVYWEKESMDFDTLDWTSIKESIGIRDTGSADNNPQKSCEKFLIKGKKFFKLKNPSAVSIAILKDLEFDIIFLVQYKGFTETKLMVAAPGASREYNQMMMRSDYVWEKLESFELKKPDKMNNDFQITFRFQNGGSTNFLGKDDVLKITKQVDTGNDAVIINFKYDGGGEDILIRQMVYSIYIIGDKNLKSSSMISKIEKVMDAMKLDLSYKPPEFKKIECK